jgi:hypothetical protein
VIAGIARLFGWKDKSKSGFGLAFGRTEQSFAPPMRVQSLTVAKRLQETLLSGLHP